MAKKDTFPKATNKSTKKTGKGGPTFDTVANGSTYVVTEGATSSPDKSDGVLRVDIKTMVAQEELAEDVAKLNRLSFPVTYEDPSQDWVNNLLNIEEIPIDDTNARRYFYEKAQSFMHKAVEQIVANNKDTANFTQEDWRQLISSLIWTAISEDEQIAPHMNDKLRELLKNVVHKFVSEDKYVLEIMDMVAAIRLESEKADKNKAQEAAAQGEKTRGTDDDKVFMVSQGKVVSISDNDSSNPVQDDNAKPGVFAFPSFGDVISGFGNKLSQIR